MATWVMSPPYPSEHPLQDSKVEKTIGWFASYPKKVPVRSVLTHSYILHAYQPVRLNVLVLSSRHVSLAERRAQKGTKMPNGGFLRVEKLVPYRELYQHRPQTVLQE